MSSKKIYLICYDIRAPHRLSRLHRYLSRHALALQYSVFATRLNSQQLMWLIRDISSIINEKEDDVRIYPLGKKCQWYHYGKRLTGNWLLAESDLLPPTAGYQKHHLEPDEKP